MVFLGSRFRGLRVSAACSVGSVSSFASHLAAQTLIETRAPEDWNQEKPAKARYTVQCQHIGVI